MSDKTNHPSSSAKSDKQVEVTVDPKTLQFAINGSPIEIKHGHHMKLPHALPVTNISVEQDKKTGEFSIKLSE